MNGGLRNVYPDVTTENPKPRLRSLGRVNLADIARQVGVAPITVSRALRTPDKVSAKTRAKIEAAAERLGYVPDLVAASLASRRSRVVAVILPTITQALFADTLQGLSDVLRPAGYQLIVADSGYSEVIETSLIATLLGRRPDGLILVGGEHSDAARRLLDNAAIPVVEIWDLPGEPLDSAVGFSNRDSVYAMTAQLVAGGRRRIGFFSTRRNTRAEARLAGFRACLHDHGLDPRRVGYPWTQAGEAGDAVAEFTKLTQRHPDLDALVCADDIIALEVLFACQRNGWPVPERLAITGFCDLPMAKRAYPALTTVRVPAYQIGAQTARLIIERLEHPETPPIQLDLGFEIVKRETA